MAHKSSVGAAAPKCSNRGFGFYLRIWTPGWGGAGAELSDPSVGGLCPTEPSMVLGTLSDPAWACVCQAVPVCAPRQGREGVWVLPSASSPHRQALSPPNLRWGCCDSDKGGFWQEKRC